MRIISFDTGLSKDKSYKENVFAMLFSFSVWAPA
jgi:hypothetical protein